MTTEVPYYLSVLQKASFEEFCKDDLAEMQNANDDEKQKQIALSIAKDFFKKWVEAKTSSQDYYDKWLAAETKGQEEWIAENKKVRELEEECDRYKYIVKFFSSINSS